MKAALKQIALELYASVQSFCFSSEHYSAKIIFKPEYFLNSSSLGILTVQVRNQTVSCIKCRFSCYITPFNIWAKGEESATFRVSQPMNHERKSLAEFFLQQPIYPHCREGRSVLKRDPCAFRISQRTKDGHCSLKLLVQ